MTEVELEQRQQQQQQLSQAQAAACSASQLEETPSLLLAQSLGACQKTLFHPFFLLSFAADILFLLLHLLHSPFTAYSFMN